MSGSGRSALCVTRVPERCSSMRDSRYELYVFTTRFSFAKCKVRDLPDPIPKAFCYWALQPVVLSNPITHGQVPLTFLRLLVLSFPRQPFALPRHGTILQRDKHRCETSILRPCLSLKRSVLEVYLWLHLDCHRIADFAVVLSSRNSSPVRSLPIVRRSDSGRLYALDWGRSVERRFECGA